MSQPTPGILLNSTSPAAPDENQNVVPQTDGATPLQSVTFYPQAATPDLLGVVKPDNKTTSVAADGTLSANPGGGTLSNPMTGEIDIDCPNAQTRGLVIKGSLADGTSSLVQVATNTQAAATSQVLAFLNPNTAGNSILVIAQASAGGGGGGATCSDSNGNTYTFIEEAGGVQAVMFLATNIKAGPNTVTYGSPYNSQGLYIIEFSGLLSSGAFDTSNDGVGSAPQSTGSITTALPNELIVVAAGRSNGGDPGALSEANSYLPIATIGGNGVYGAVWYGIAASAASYSDTVSSANIGTLFAVILAFKIQPFTAEQIADPLDIEDGSGNVLSGINGLGQFVLPVTSGLPTNTPNGPALSYDQTAGEVDLYSNGEWAPLGGGGGGGSTLTEVEEYPDGTIDGVNTVFTLSYTPAPGTLFFLFRNGIKQNRITSSPVNGPLDFTLSGNTITFTVPPAAGSQPDVIIAQYLH